MAPVSVSVCHKSVFYQKDEQIKLHSGAEASFNQSLHCHLRKFVYLQNKGRPYFPLELFPKLRTQNKKLSYRRGTARCVVSAEILPIATQQCRTTCTTSPEEIEVMKLEGYSGTMCNKHVHSTMTRSSRLHCPIGVVDKPTTVELWISPAYTDDLLWRNFLSPQCRNCSRDPDHAHSGNTHSSQDKDFAWPTRLQNLKSLALAVAEIHVVWNSTRGHLTLTLSWKIFFHRQGGTCYGKSVWRLKSLGSPVTKLWMAVQNAENGVVWFAKKCTKNAPQIALKVMGNATIR